MKGKLIYITIFLAAFVVTTGIIIYLNNSFNNIFAFDFSKPKPYKAAVEEVKQKAPEHLLEKKIIEKIADQNIKKDSSAKKEEIIHDSGSRTEEIAVDSSKLNRKKTEPVVPVVNGYLNTGAENTQTPKVEIVENKEYVEWTKKTAGLYEAMDPKRAAKIIQNYSDNVARDIIYAMKKKKAAEILSELSPETAQKITKIRQ